METNELIESIHNALFQWYDFPKGADIYFFDKETIALQQGKKYDYIISKTDIESYEKPTEFLKLCKSLLKEDGHLLLAVNNRFGIKYFCGDKDFYTHRCFDGIEDYANADAKGERVFQGRTYAKSQLQKFLKEAGFLKCRFFSVLSDLENPVLIYREDFLPNEDLVVRVFPTYNSPKTIFLEEGVLYKGLVENDMFHQMANAYIIECVMETNVGLSDIRHVTSSVERGRESAIITTIHDSGLVEKKAIYKEGQERIQKLYKYGEELRANGIKMVPAEYENGRYQMPFVELENGQMYLKRLLKEDEEKFLCALDLFRDTILKSSRIVKEDCKDEEGTVLEYGYFDLVPLNSFFDGTDFIFYDQEFREANYPANVLIFRMIATLYSCDPQMEKSMPKESLLKRYGLQSNLQKWQKMEWDFLDKLRNEALLEEYHNEIRVDVHTLQANRKRMEYSAEYCLTQDKRIYRNIFQNADTKKLILFGSGIYAERFWKYFGEKYPVYAVVDNQESKWGTYWHDILIYSPKRLLELEENSYKVMICAAGYEPIIQQLDEMGIKEYSVFDVQRLCANVENLVH